MGVLNNNGGGSNNDWIARALANGGQSFGNGGGMGFLYNLLAQHNPGAPAPGGFQNAPTSSPSTGSPATMWWDKPGAGTMGVTQAQPLPNRAPITRFGQAY